MSCKECENYQKNKIVAYYRWGNANIELSGCPDHVRGVINVLNEEQSRFRKPQGILSFKKKKP